MKAKRNTNMFICIFSALMMIPAPQEKMSSLFSIGIILGFENYDQIQQSR